MEQNTFFRETLKDETMKNILKILICIFMICIGCVSVTAAGSGSGLGFSGDLLISSFPGEGETKAEASRVFEKEMTDIAMDYITQHDLRLLIATYKSANSIGISSDDVGDDIEAFADRFSENERYGGPAQNLICMVYIAESNQFACRTFLQEDSGIDIDWDSIENIFCSEQNIQEKIRTVCKTISGEKDMMPSESGIPFWPVIIAVAALIIIVVIDSQVGRKQRNM